MRQWGDESGQMIVMLAVSLSTLLAFMGLAVDVGLLFHARRQVQTAADAAASAAALDYRYNGSTSVQIRRDSAAASARRSRQLQQDGFRINQPEADDWDGRRERPARLVAAAGDSDWVLQW